MTGPPWPDHQQIMSHRVSDHHRHRLAVPDVRALLRLCNGLHAAAAAAVAHAGRGGTPNGDGADGGPKRMLLEGVRDLTGAEHASAALAMLVGPDSRNTPKIVWSGHTGGDQPAPPVGREAGDDAASAAHAPDGCPTPWHVFLAMRPRAARPWASQDWCVAAHAAPARRRRPAAQAPAKVVAAGDEHCVHSFLPLASGKAIACLTVRRGRTRPRFSARERAMLRALHAEAGWVYRGDVVGLTPDAAKLSPRELETLKYLLAGLSEKQVAAAMKLRYNTIHHYVKAIHKHFGVSARAELLARWLAQ